MSSILSSKFAAANLEPNVLESHNVFIDPFVWYMSAYGLA